MYNALLPARPCAHVQGAEILGAEKFLVFTNNFIENLNGPLIFVAASHVIMTFF